MKRARCTLPSLENAVNPLVLIMTQPNYMTIRKGIFTALEHDDIATLWSLKVAFPGIIFDRYAVWNWLSLGEAHVSSMNFRHKSSPALRLEIYQAIKSTMLACAFMETFLRAMEFDDPEWLLQEFWTMQLNDECKKAFIADFRTGFYRYFIHNPGNGDGIIAFLINEVFHERHGSICDFPVHMMENLLATSICRSYTFPNIMKLLRLFDGICTFGLVDIYDRAWIVKNVSVIRECREAMNEPDRMIVREFSLRHHLQFCSSSFKNVKNGSIADMLKLDMEINNCMTMEHLLQILYKIIDETTCFDACLPLLLDIYSNFGDAIFDNDANAQRIWPYLAIELSGHLNETIIKYIHCIINYFPDVMRRFRLKPLYTSWIQRIRSKSMQENKEGTTAKRILGMLGA